MSLVLPAKTAPALIREASFAPFIVRIARRFLQWRAHRRAARQLSYFSDAMLKDIGITRGDIPGAVRYGRPHVFDVDHGNSQ